MIAGLLLTVAVIALLCVFLGLAAWGVWTITEDMARAELNDHRGDYAQQRDAIRRTHERITANPEET